MNVFVLSGGGSLGAIQAGMLEALLEEGIAADAVVGTSIGAANAAFLAADPSLHQARALSELWRTLRTRDVFPFHPLRSARSLLRAGALFDPAPFRTILEDSVGFAAIEDAPIPLRIVATDFDEGSEAVFERGSVTDAVLASTALPGVFPPHRVNDRWYLDGGLVDHVPIAPAIELGADTIYVLSCGFPCPPERNRRSPRRVIAHSLAIMLSQRVRVDIRRLPSAHPDLKVVSLPPVCTHAGIRDLRSAAQLIATAKEQTLRFLAGDDCKQCTHRHAPRGEVMRPDTAPEAA